MTRAELDALIAPPTKVFRVGSRQFVGEMISPRTDPQLREWILADVAVASPAVALSAMNEMMSQNLTGEAVKVFDGIRLPVLTVNGDLWPINYAANRRHNYSCDAIVLRDADHLLMMDRPKAFNVAFEKAVRRLMEKQGGNASRADRTL